MLFLSIITASAATATVSVSGRKLTYRGICSSELGGGECHSSEHSAGILSGLGRRAFLIGNAVIRRLNEKLSRTLDSDDREDTERDVELVTVVGCIEVACEAITNYVGNVAAIAKAAGGAGTRAVNYS